MLRLFIFDNGYPSRAFAFGGALGIVSSLILGKRDQTKLNPNFKSSYKIMGLAFLGIIFVWCSYPILILSNVYVITTGKIIAMIGQVNIWLALAASVLGCYTASAISYRKFSVHDMIFSSITVTVILYREQLHSVRRLKSTIIQEQPQQLGLQLDYFAHWRKLDSNAN